MKKRTMKKWIHEGQYCYKNENSEEKLCKWHRVNNNKSKQENGYCMYLKQGDWNEGTLLWDKCKECGCKE